MDNLLTQLPLANTSPHALMPAHLIWFATTDWLGPWEITLCLTQALSILFWEVLLWRCLSQAPQVLTCHARPLPMRLPSKTCISSDTPCEFTFLQGLPPHPAWALKRMWLPSLYSGLWHLAPHMGPFLTEHGCWLSDWLTMAHHSCSTLPNSFRTKIFKTKGGMKGKGKTLCFNLEHEGKVYSCYHSPNLKEEAAFFNLSDIWTNSYKLLNHQKLNQY